MAMQNRTAMKAHQRSHRCLVVCFGVDNTSCSPGLRSCTWLTVWNLASEAVEGASLALEGIDDVHGGNGLPASVLGVGDGVTDNVLEENLEHRAGLLVDEAGDTLHTTTASETADSGLGDALDVVTKNLPVTLGASLAKALTTLATSRHVVVRKRLRIAGLQIWLLPKPASPSTCVYHSAGR
jgi:hypothetical protein